MIYRIYSDLPTFKEVEFRQGLNIFITDKSPGATDQQTRNRAGKTSLIEIIHFLLGSKCNKDSIFRYEELKDFSFGMEFDLGSTKIAVERSGNQRNKIQIRTSDTSEWPITVQSKINGDLTLSNTNWKTVLGAVIFGLREDTDPNMGTKFSPTFRSLFPYFARRERAGALKDPIMQSDKQQLWDQQVALSYLINLDWTIAQRWQVVREHEKALRGIKKAAGEGLFEKTIGGDVASLRTQLSVAEGKIYRLKQEIANFNLLPQYHDLELEASRLSQQLAKLSDENIIDQALITDIESSLVQEKPPAIDDIRRLYDETGLVLPDKIMNYFEDLIKFHDSIIENRKSYLSSEIEIAKR